MKLTHWTSGYVAVCTLVVASSCALPDSRFQPVTSTHQSHLGIRIEAPGVDSWQMHEQRAADKWFVLFKKTDPGDPKRTQFVSLDAARFTRVEKKVFDRDVGLRQFVEGRLQQGRTQTSARFRELESAVVTETVNGIKAVRGSILWEERSNPHFPDAVLRLDNAYYFFPSPGDPNVLIMVHSSTREPIGDQRLSVKPLAERFIETMSYY